MPNSLKSILKDPKFPQAPSQWDRDGAAKALHKQRRLYAFRNYWLPSVLSADEYAEVKGLSDQLLTAMYAPIYEAGPNGYEWQRQVRQLFDLLEDLDPDVAAVDVMREMRALYHVRVEVYREEHAETYDKIFDRASKMALPSHPLTDLRRESRLMYQALQHAPIIEDASKVSMQDWANMMDAITLHTKFILNRPVLESESSFDSLLQAHDAFALKYGL